MSINYKHSLDSRSALIYVFFLKQKIMFCSPAWFLARKGMLKKCSALVSALLEGPIPGEVGGRWSFSCR